MVDVALVKCPNCGFEGIKEILVSSINNDKRWVCAECKTKHKNTGIKKIY